MDFSFIYRESVAIHRFPKLDLVGGTVQTVKQKLPNCKGVILFNCFFRYLQFKKDNQRELIAAEYKKLGPICGFNTHGEQLNRHHMNQTLTLIAFGE